MVYFKNRKGNFCIPAKATLEDFIDIQYIIKKTKKLTNIRASGTDDKVILPPPVVFSLEEALEYIQEDEYVEVTPKYMRMRKIILDENERRRKIRS